MADQDQDDGFSDELLEQLQEQSQLLEVIDESQDAALDLHTAPFDRGVRERLLAFLQSSRYRKAADRFAALREDIPPAECGGGNA